MGSGLSMTSVNKIKELATAREYSLALEIIDSQDLTKSLNPQFIRLCGDVYIANKRYKDARKVLLMAHKMAPEAKRVIFSLVDLYLRMGYKDLAEFYYRLYMFDAEPGLPQTNQINYIYNKAQGCPPQEIETLLFPMYSDVMDYDWSYELFLLMKIQGKEEEAEAIRVDYIATFKNEPNVLLIEELEQSNYKLNELFYIYPKETVADDSPEEEELRQEEKPLMEADDLRMNPKEAEIQILFDYSEKATFGEKMKYKRHMKEQEKLAKKAEKESVQESSDDTTSATALDVENSSEDMIEEGSLNGEGQQESDTSETIDTKVSIFKKIFSRKKTEYAEDIVSEETDNIVETEKQEEQSQEQSSEESQDVVGTTVVEESYNAPEEFDEVEDGSDELAENSDEIDVESDEVTEISDETDMESEVLVEKIGGIDVESDEFVEISDESDIKSGVVTDEFDNLDVESDDLTEESDELDVNEVDTATEDESDEESIDDIGDSVMQEIYGKKKISIVSELGEDTFVNTQDLTQESDTSNPFEELLGHVKKSDDEIVKSSFIFEEVQLQPEDDNEYEVDDFSDDFAVLDFDSETNEAIVDSLGDTAEEVESEKYHTENADSEIEHLTVEDDNYSTEAENNAHYVDVAKSDVEDYYVSENTTPEDNESQVENAVVDTEEYQDEIVEPESEEYQDENLEPETEEYQELDDEIHQQEYDEPEVEALEEESVETEVSEERNSIQDLELHSGNLGIKDVLESESVYDSLKEKGRMDFPEFKSSLFPEYGQTVVEVKNNFNEIMSEAQDKINENLLKEEQMQREAEALLASLGIDLGDIKQTIKPDESTIGFNKEEYGYTPNPVVETTQVQPQNSVVEQISESVTETVNNYSPSRDELKSSLKIDSVKKNILKQIKEYR